jgi:hypothetical protein
LSLSATTAQQQLSEFVNKSVSKVEQSFSSLVAVARNWGHSIQEATTSQYETAVRVSTALGPGLAFKPRTKRGPGGRPVPSAAPTKWVVYLEDGRREELAFSELKFGAGVEIDGRRRRAEEAPRYVRTHRHIHTLQYTVVAAAACAMHLLTAL